MTATQTMEVVVAGSVNLDHRLLVQALPAEGETVLALGYEGLLGGKGANQAAACSLARAPTVFVADVGRGQQSDVLRRELARFPLRLELEQTDVIPGQAWVQVDRGGKNLITVLPGANAMLEPEAVLAALDRDPARRVLVLQCEIPVGTIARSVRGASDRGVRVVLNLAPPVPLPRDVIGMVGTLIVNEHEAQALAERVVRFQDDSDLRTLRRQLGVEELVVTVGAEGAILVDGPEDRVTRAAAPPVDRVVDTTGAGDAFVGVYAAAIAQGVSAQDALGRAARAATDSTQRVGAASSYLLG